MFLNNVMLITLPVLPQGTFSSTWRCEAVHLQWLFKVFLHSHSWNVHTVRNIITQCTQIASRFICGLCNRLFRHKAAVKRRFEKCYTLLGFNRWHCTCIFFHNVMV